MEIPSFEDMVAALASPIVPSDALELSDSDSEEMSLSTDDMIREIFTMMKNRDPANQHRTGAGVSRPGTLLDSIYNSSTDTYDGLPVTGQYNGGALP